MFVQVIQGRTTDPEALRSAFDRWLKDLASDADGWLGMTGGVTDDGRFIALVRFADAAAARRNSDRPEQGAWWAETAQLFEGDPTFHDTEKVMVDVTGDPDTAGFVQVLQGRTTDAARARELMGRDPEEWAAFRPDVIGSVLAEHEDDAWTMAVYFTSEAEAREGERKEPPETLKAQMAELDALNAGQPEYFDLRDPWIFSPA